MQFETVFGSSVQFRVFQCSLEQFSAVWDSLVQFLAVQVQLGKFRCSLGNFSAVWGSSVQFSSV